MNSSKPNPQNVKKQKKKKTKKKNEQKRKQKRNTILDSSWPRALRITPVHLRHWRTKLERHKSWIQSNTSFFYWRMPMHRRHIVKRRLHSEILTGLVSLSPLPVFRVTGIPWLLAYAAILWLAAELVILQHKALECFNDFGRAFHLLLLIYVLLISVTETFLFWPKIEKEEPNVTL